MWKNSFRGDFGPDLRHNNVWLIKLARVRPEYFINIQVLYMKILHFMTERERERLEHFICVKCLVVYIFRHIVWENDPNVFEHWSSVHELRTWKHVREGQTMRGQKLMSVLSANLHTYSCHNERDKDPKILSVMRFSTWILYVVTTEIGPKILPMLSVKVHKFLRHNEREVEKNIFPNIFSALSVKIHIF